MQVDFPLLKIRSMPASLPGRERADVIRSAPLPSVNDPAHFIETLKFWELQLGTGYAALAGMVATDEHVEHKNIILGLESFERSFNLLRPDLELQTPQQLGHLNWRLTAPLTFAPETDFGLGLKIFESNLADYGTDEVGNCVVCGALAATLALESGTLAGESHLIRTDRDTLGFHSGAYFPTLSRTYDIGFFPPRITEPSAATLQRLVLSSNFSFISSLLISKVDNRMAAYQGSPFPPSELDAINRQLALSAAINPFSYYLHLIWSGICTDREKRMQIFEEGDRVSQLRGEAIHFL